MLHPVGVAATGFSLKKRNICFFTLGQSSAAQWISSVLHQSFCCNRTKDNMGGENGEKIWGHTKIHSSFPDLLSHAQPPPWSSLCLPPPPTYLCWHLRSSYPCALVALSQAPLQWHFCCHGSTSMDGTWVLPVEHVDRIACQVIYIQPMCE